MPTRSQAELAAERAFLWRWIAAAFTYPDPEIWPWLNETADLVSPGPAGSLRSGLDLSAAQSAYLAVFGHTVRGDCPPHEIEFGELKADWLFQPHRLADIAAFYSAFGLEVPDDADERVDHIAMECEFYSILCAKEAATLAEDAREHIEICRSAQKKFLREHLGRWTPSFSRRLERLTNDRFLQALAGFLRASVIAECERFGIAAGNEDIQLRPADDMVDPCGKCGIEGLNTKDVTA